MAGSKVFGPFSVASPNGATGPGAAKNVTSIVCAA